MKAITLTQPWATLVAIGAKKIETRSWRTPYRGPLAIHAAKGYPRWAKETCCDEPFQTALLREVYNLPLGYVIATCRLVACIPTRELQNDGPIYMDPESRVSDPFMLDAQERAFGDYEPGRWAWLLADIERLPVAIRARGALSLWEWEKP